MKNEQLLLTIKLHCIDLPGRSCDGKANIKVGVQKDKEIIDDVFGDTNQVDFLYSLRVERNLKTGKPNFLGPYAHGTPTERFLYLSWGERHGKSWLQFGRVKIHLKDIEWQSVEKAVAAGCPIEATLKLTDKRGKPLCASVKPENIKWKL